MTGCQAAPCLQPLLILTLEPERLKNRPTTPEGVTGTWEEVLQRDAQAACSFNLSALKGSPFFQMVSVMAAILRAKVSRAMVGFMPLASARS